MTAILKEDPQSSSPFVAVTPEPLRVSCLRNSPATGVETLSLAGTVVGYTKRQLPHEQEFAINICFT